MRSAGAIPAMVRPRSRIRANSNEVQGNQQGGEHHAVWPGPVSACPAEKNSTARCASSKTSRENKMRLELKAPGEEQSGGENRNIIEGERRRDLREQGTVDQRHRQRQQQAAGNQPRFPYVPPLSLVHGMLLSE